MLKDPNAHKLSQQGRNNCHFLLFVVLPISAQLRCRLVELVKSRPAAVPNLARLGIKALISGTMASYLSARLPGFLT